jgi:glycosyltransferase involved in cell wall biosynthesis
VHIAFVAILVRSRDKSLDFAQSGESCVTKTLRVGIALATYKPDLQFLRLQLESIRAQTHGNWFLLAHDDQSMSQAELEGTIFAVIPRTQSEVVISNERRGAVGNFAAALVAMPKNCELIAFCDQDDEWLPEKLEKLVSYFDDPRVMAVHSDLSLVNSVGHQISSSCWSVERRDHTAKSAEKFILRNPVTGCSLIFRSSLLQDALPIPLQPMKSPYFYHDVWIALIALLHGRVVACPAALVRYRQHGKNAVGAEQRSARKFGSWRGLKNKCLKALKSRQVLESAYQARGGRRALIFSGRFDFGVGVFWRTLLWSATASRGYLAIGLQLTFGKFLWDMGMRLEEQKSEIAQ